ncbi:MAG: hypothetical protein PHR26_03360 [Candidatus ainarchaeum sp.]|nr:hypothetical protein [Candidatus ainarchaeum sp.]MDD3975941.1 hypothetical protein [Candidatus ainarchaeum sp.]
MKLELIDYIKSERKKKVEDKYIKQALYNYGFTKKEIEDSFKYIKIEESKLLFNLKSSFSKNNNIKKDNNSNLKDKNDTKIQLDNNIQSNLKKSKSKNLKREKDIKIDNNYLKFNKDSYSIKFFLVLLIIIIFGVLLYFIFIKELFLFNSLEKNSNFEIEYINSFNDNVFVSGNIKIRSLINSYDFNYSEKIILKNISETEFKKYFKEYLELNIYSQPIIITKYNSDYRDIFNISKKDENIDFFNKTYEFNEILYSLKEKGFEKEIEFILDSKNLLNNYHYLLEIEYNNVIYKIIEIILNKNNTLYIKTYDLRGYTKSKELNSFQVVDYVLKNTNILDSLLFNITNIGEDFCVDLDEITCKSKIGCFPEYEFDIYGNMTYINCR